ncbi:MAG: penicillin acylase family protein, partial [Myxococcaceae bacterium]
MRLLALLLSLSLCGCAAGTLLSYRVSPDYPSVESGELALPGLTRPVRIYYDAYGVPHLEAENELDLLRAVGFSHGRDRYFEMDMMRRFARGRVAELVGDQPLLSGSTVDFDRSMRGWELEERAGATVARLSPEERARIEAYCAGVNAARTRHPPLEHRLLGVQAEPWLPEDTWVVGLLNAWTVSHNWQQETARLLLALSVGLDRAEAIYPAEPLGGGRTLSGDGEERQLLPSVAPELREYLAKLPLAASLPGGRLSAGPDLLQLAGASNAWVVSGARSASGKPVLTNDPHLSHLIPSIVYQQHLKAPGLDVIGITIPGVPWVLMGHNQKLAWGLTSTVGDVMDLVVEREDPARPGFVLHEGGDCALTARSVVLNVKDGEARTLRLRRTCNGPVLNDLVPELFPKGAPLVAVRWQLDGIEQSIEALFRANKAGSVAELRAQAASMASPIQTFTAADVEGHIATFVSGTVPVRRAHRGTFAVPGWLSKYGWDGIVPNAALPSGLDPASGFFAHANNLMVDPRQTAAPLNIDAAPPYRYERVVERLGAIERHDLNSLADIQQDVKLLRAVRVLPRILEDLEGFTVRS